MRALTPWFRKNGGPLDAFRDEMDEWTRRFFGSPLAEFAAPKAWMPSVDVEETEKEFIVKADLPGVEPKDVDVSFENGFLVLHGHKKEEHEEKGKNFRRVERFAGEFYRELPMPTGVEADKVSAICSKGVVTITVPKKAATLPKKIAVKPQE